MDEPGEAPADAPDEDTADSRNEGTGILDRLRGTGVGVEDPNIVGDVGPTDVAPGADPDEGFKPS